MNDTIFEEGAAVSRDVGLGAGQGGSLAWRSTEAAIARYHEAKRWAAEVEAEQDSYPWATLANYRAIDAERGLLETILAASPGFSELDLSRCVYRHWPARGFVSGGRIYLAMPSLDFDGPVGTESDYWVMRLAIVEVDSIEGIEGVHAAAATVIGSNLGRGARS